MTTEEKAKAYDMALEGARKELGVDRKEWEVVQRVLHNIFPELAESEDERIRRMCISAVNIAASADGGLLHSEASECLAWLEEQKDKNCLACDQHLKGYLAGRKVTEEEKQKENPKSSDSIPSDCVSVAKCEDRWYKVEDFLPDSGRDVLAKDALGNYLIANYDGDRWYISGYDNEDKPIVYTPAIKEWCDIPSEKQKEQTLGLPAGFYFIDKNGKKYYTDTLKCGNLKFIANQKEQKPSWSEDFGKEVESVHKRYPEVSFAKLTRIAYHFAKWADKYKSTEWSEEDEKVIEAACALLCEYAGYYKEKDMEAKNLQLFKVSQRLKSLRPSWKPSEEQMKALLNAEGFLRAGLQHDSAKTIAELYEHLKKLM